MKKKKLLLQDHAPTTVIKLTGDTFIKEPATVAENKHLSLQDLQIITSIPPLQDCLQSTERVNKPKNP